MGDLAIGDPEDVHLLVPDPLAGRFDAVKGPTCLPVMVAAAITTPS